MKRFTNWLMGVVTAIAVVVSSSGFADRSEHLKVVVIHSGESALLIHLTSELRAMGFLPVLVERTTQSPDPEEMGRIADAHGAVAVMTVLGPGKEIEVWVNTTGESTEGQSELIMAEQNRREALIALRAVELLRANLIEIRTNKKKTSPPKKTTPSVRRKAPLPPTQSRTWAVTFQPALSHGFGDFNPTMHLAVGTSVRFGRFLGLSLLGLAPTIPMTIALSEVSVDGSVDVRTGYVGLGLALFLMPSNRRIQSTLNAGIGPLFVSMRGHASPPYAGKKDLTVSALMSLDVSLSVALHRHVSLRMDLLAGTAEPRSVVRVVDNDVTHYGRPFLCGMLGLEVWLR